MTTFTDITAPESFVPPIQPGSAPTRLVGTARGPVLGRTNTIGAGDLEVLRQIAGGFTDADRGKLDTVHNRVDDTITSRAAPADVEVSGQFTSSDRMLLENSLKTSEYVAADNTTISNIDSLLTNNLDVAVSTRTEPADLPPAPDNTTISDTNTKVTDNLDAKVSSRAKPSDLPPAPNNTAISAIKSATDSFLDATVSSRSTLKASDLPPAPDNTTITDTNTKVTSGLDVKVSSRAEPSDLPPAPDNTAINAIKSATDSNLDATVSSRSTLTTSDLPSEPDNTTISDTNTKVANNLDAAVSTRSTLGVNDLLTAQDVWDHPDRTLTQIIGLTPEQAEMVKELWRIHGLDPSAKLQITDTSRSTKAVEQEISDDGSTTEITRK